MDNHNGKSGSMPTYMKSNTRDYSNARSGKTSMQPRASKRSIATRKENAGYEERSSQSLPKIHENHQKSIKRSKKKGSGKAVTKGGSVSAR